jgi:hypothetical protein
MKVPLRTSCWPTEMHAWMVRRTIQKGNRPILRRPLVEIQRGLPECDQDYATTSRTQRYSY